MRRKQLSTAAAIHAIYPDWSEPNLSPIIIRMFSFIRRALRNGRLVDSKSQIRNLHKMPRLLSFLKFCAPFSLAAVFLVSGLDKLFRLDEFIASLHARSFLPSTLIWAGI